jgi:hypothetical protein
MASDPSPTTVVSTRLSESQLARLHALAQAEGCSMSVYLRRLVTGEATGQAPVQMPPPARNPMVTRENYRDALREGARAGSGPAVRGLREMDAEDRVDRDLERLRGLTTDA